MPNLPEVRRPAKQPLFTANEWTFERLEAVDRACAHVAEDDLRLDTYSNQIEVISAEQMLDAYTSVGLPVFYPHWSFGKQRAIETGRYRRGEMGLAYELVINSNPCISYLLEENTMTMQTLVIAHAAYGHNAFFKNNVFFQQWTDADGILDYLLFAKRYIRECEERYGFSEVARVLDAAHSLSANGIDHARRPGKLSAKEEEEQRRSREAFLEQQLSDLWRTIPVGPEQSTFVLEETQPLFPPAPEENLLYFLEKNAPKLETWKREILRIVRKVSQYLYPQSQTKIMNEGFACFTHYFIMHRLHEQGWLTDGTMLEFYASHTAVTAQPSFRSPHYSGINPYALGFAIFQDIRRICLHPTDEDRAWFPFAGDPDWVSQIHFAMREFRDDSFVLQYLSPKVIRDLRLFAIHQDGEEDDHFLVTAIQDDTGVRAVRESLARQITALNRAPDIQIVRVDRLGDRTLEMVQVDPQPLDTEDTDRTLLHFHYLWGYPVRFFGAGGKEWSVP
mgnify:CR=1 FL=1